MKLFRGALEITWYGGLKTQVRQMVLRGEIISAIRYVREKRGWSLTRAKEYVDDIRCEPGYRRYV